MSTYADNLTAEYELRRKDYDAFTESVRILLEQLMRNAEIDVLAIENRTKDLASFREKVDRPDKAEKYQTCADVTDLSGVRVIIHLREELERVCDLIREHFAIDEKNSANKEELLDPDKFGYRSTHFVVSFGADRLRLPEFRRFSGMKAEIQVRTVLQHAWAAIDWKLRYKADVGVPNSIRRRLYRISALLESADDDFSLVSMQVRELREGYEKQIQEGDLSIEVNQESLALFLDSSTVISRLRDVATSSEYVIAPWHPDSRNPLVNVSQTLNIAGIDTIEKLKARLEAAEPTAGDFLHKILTAWRTPNKPLKLVIDLGGLVRLLVIQTSSKQVAREILQKNPFGPELHRAVTAVLAR